MADRQRGLADVQRFVVPDDIVRATLEVLQEAGNRGQEAFVLWGGRHIGRELRIRSALRPHQIARQTEDGLLVTVTGRALFSVNKSLYARGEVLAAQIHSHPGEAFHSSTDDLYPLVTLLGALSLVVPDFGRAGMDGIENWAWYRLTGTATWVEVDPSELVTIEQ